MSTQDERTSEQTSEWPSINVPPFMVVLNHSAVAADDVPIWLTWIQCTGDEQNLYDCLYEVEGEENGRKECVHREDMWVDCN